MIAPGARAVIDEGEIAGIRIHHRQRLQQALGVLVKPQDGLPVGFRQQPLQGALVALDFMDGLGLSPAFIDTKEADPNYSFNLFAGVARSSIRLGTHLDGATEPPSQPLLS